MKKIFEDDDLLVISKDFGELVQNSKNFSNSISEKFESYHLLNRLDAPVGGLVIFTKTKKTTEIMTYNQNNNLIKKNYLCVVTGDVKVNGVLENYILKNQRLNTSKIVNNGTQKSKYAKLIYDLLEVTEINSNKYSLLKIDLITGRHHQIRVQLANINHGIVNDKKYSKNNIGGVIGLFSQALEFKHPISNELIKITDVPTQKPFNYFNYINNIKQ